MRLFIPRDPLFGGARLQNVWVPSVTIAASTSTNQNPRSRSASCTRSALALRSRSRTTRVRFPSLLPVRAALHHVPRARRPLCLGRAPNVLRRRPAARRRRISHSAQTLPFATCARAAARSACTQAALVLGSRAKVLRRQPAARSSPAASPPRPVHHVDSCCCSLCLRAAAPCPPPCRALPRTVPPTSAPTRAPIPRACTAGATPCHPYRVSLHQTFAFPPSQKRASTKGKPW
jgi:hypothetical protein